MSTYLPRTLLEMWSKSMLSVEMAIGHILQRLLKHEERLSKIENELGYPSQES